MGYRPDETSISMTCREAENDKETAENLYPSDLTTFNFAPFDIDPIDFIPLDSPCTPARGSWTDPPRQDADRGEVLPVSVTGEAGEKEGGMSDQSHDTAISSDAEERALIPVSEVDDGFKIATRQDIEALQNRHQLPANTGGSVSWMRYCFLSLYRRLMAIVFLANFVALLACIVKAAQGRFTYGQAANATSVTLFAGTLMRHENYINLVFWSITRIPNTAPIALRRSFAKFAYSQGGIHAGSGVSAFGWLVLYVILACRQLRLGTAKGNAMAVMSSVTGLVLLTIITTAHPTFRNRYHNAWENIHRYGGYTAIGLVWAQIILIAVITSDSNTGMALIQTPAFWFLLIITGFIIHPYLYLRRLPVDAEKLSNHATRLRFHDQTLPSCVAARLGHNPLTENHAFATIPNRDGEEKGYSVIISNAGDWTRDIIDNPPKKIWIKGAPTRGVMRIASLFKPIVVVTTGSGIGPCLSFLQVNPNHPLRIIWSARFPEQTYGKEIMSSVLTSDPNAIIIDTKVTGQPDLEALTYALYKDIEAEAIVIISNPKVTRDVVFTMESRDVPAFGAIFDS